MDLTLQNIAFSFDQSRIVLNDIALGMEKGDTMSIVGVSGCGKSTLLRLIAGILPSNPSHSFKGEVRIFGGTPEEYRKTGKLSFMFQEATLMPNLTVRKNIELPLTIKGEKNGAKVDKLLNMVGLEDYANYLPKQLSGGMKTRVALARSFVTGPELLLLDEPFSALDVAWKDELYKELEMLQDEYGTTVILVTHDIYEAIRLSGENIIILGGNGVILSSTKLDENENIQQRIRRILLEDHSLKIKA